MPQIDRKEARWWRLSQDRGWPVALAIGALSVGVLPWLHTNHGVLWSWQVLAESPWPFVAWVLSVWVAAAGVLVAGAIADDFRFAWVVTALSGVGLLLMGALWVSLTSRDVAGDVLDRVGPMLMSWEPSGLWRMAILPVAVGGVFVVSGARLRARSSDFGYRLAQGMLGAVLVAAAALEIAELIRIWRALTPKAMRLPVLPDLGRRVQVVLGVAVFSTVLALAGGGVAVGHAATRRRDLLGLAKLSVVLVSASVWFGGLLCGTMPGIFGAPQFTAMAVALLVIALGLPVFFCMGLARLIPLALARRSARAAEEAHRAEAASEEPAA